MGRLRAAQVGEWVLAIGSPFQLSPTVTAGIISATGRTNVGFADYEDFIQTDAAINPGNSGGALVNTRGELVGINTGIFSQSGGYQGIGFAVPSNLAQHVIGRSPEVRRGPPRLDRHFPRRHADRRPRGAGRHADRPRRAWSRGCTGVRPAYDAGLRPGDVIVGFNGQNIDDASQLLADGRRREDWHDGDIEDRAEQPARRDEDSDSSRAPRPHHAAGANWYLVLRPSCLVRPRCVVLGPVSRCD